jgi:glycosyltransferase involved in cell wall biosynthesis
MVIPMKLSVLINNYNYARFLPEALQSVVSQTLAPHEIIVVDDGSIDNSKEVLEDFRGNFPSLRLHFQLNGGQLSAIRSAMRLASGDWCLFLDADDAWESAHLANAANAMAASPDAAVWYAGHRESEGAPLFRSKWPAGAVGPCAALVSATGVRIGTITSAIGLRRDLVQEILALPEELDSSWRIRADDVLLYTAALAGAVIHYSPEPTVRYRIHGGNHFARTREDSEAYANGKETLFDLCRERYGIESNHHLELLRDELAVMSAERRSHEVRRRYLRAIRRANAPFTKRVMAYFSSFLLSGNLCS